MISSVGGVWIAVSRDDVVVGEPEQFGEERCAHLHVEWFERVQHGVGVLRADVGAS